MDIYSFFATPWDYENRSLHLRQEKGQTLSLVSLPLIEQALHDDEAALLQQILSPIEQGYYQRFNYMKRKKDWLGGRLAGKSALLSLIRADNPDLREITILPNDHGRPLVGSLPDFCPSTDNLMISLSHSEDFAVAAATEGLICGIDLQIISTKLVDLTSHFATDTELQLLAEKSGCDEDTHLTMLWTAKEALKKALLHDQPVIFSVTELQEIIRTSNVSWRFNCRVQEQNRSVSVYLLPPYVLSLAEEPDHA